MMTRHRAVRMLPRSTAIFAIASLWVCTLGAAAAQSVDPSIVGFWEAPDGMHGRTIGRIFVDVAADGFVSGRFPFRSCLMVGSIVSDKVGTAQVRCPSDSNREACTLTCPRDRRGACFYTCRANLSGSYTLRISKGARSDRLTGITISDGGFATGAEEFKRQRHPFFAGVAPAIAGHWSGHGVTLDITSKVELSGTFGDCTFRSSRAAVSDVYKHRWQLLGYVDAICSGQPQRSLLAWVDATPAGGRVFEGEEPQHEALTLELSDARETFTVRDMSRSNGLGSASPNSIDPAIAGNWSGAADGTQLTLDLAADGSFSGAISGGVLGGCAFEGSTDPGSALVNNETSFLDFGVATLSGCDVSTNDGDDYFVLLGATPKSLGISFFADEQAVGEDAPVLKIDGLSRSAGGL